MKKQILACLDRYPHTSIENLNGEIKLIWGTDGLPLCRGSQRHAWPIMAFIYNIQPRIVFHVVMAVGPSVKPSGLEFLQEFIDEASELLEIGIQYKGKTYSINIMAGILDAQARSFVKCIKSTNGYYGCDQCQIRGLSDNSRMLYIVQDTENCEKRTDENFRNMSQPEHHIGKTPLLKLKIDMVNCYPVDFMHQSGGLMKKILECWFGTRKTNYRVPTRTRPIINQRIRIIKKCVPKDLFPRRIRTLDNMKYYKYTEIKQILLYVGKIIFLDVLHENNYDNFLSFSIAMTLLCDSDNAKNYVHIAKTLLENVDKDFPQLYSHEFMSYNAHAIKHLPDVVEYHNCSLSNLSAYAFENELRHVKKYNRSSQKSLPQLVKGIYRRNSVLGKVNNKLPKINHTAPKNIYIDPLKHIIYEVLKKYNDGITFKTNKFKGHNTVKDFFKEPVRSSYIGCYKILRKNGVVTNVSRSALLVCRRGIKIPLSQLNDIVQPDLQHYDFVQMVCHNQDEQLFS